jgi:hypothetical protein
MATPKSRARRGPKRWAIRLACRLAPAGRPARVYLVCGPDGPLAAVVGGDTGEDELAAAGFANCSVAWELTVPYEMIRIARGLLPRLAKRGAA